MSRLLIFLLLPLSAWCQHHDQITLIGYQGGPFGQPNDGLGISVLRFPDGSLKVEENFELGMYFDLTNTSFSDSAGNLQFYSNGGYVGNTDWQTMENSEMLTDDGLGPNHWPQFILALPKPGHADRAVLLYGDEEFYWPFGPEKEVWVVSKNLLAAEIDMAANNGLGKVVSRGDIIIEDTLSIGKFTATKHANGRDWWILAHEQYTNRYYRILLDPDGLHNLGPQAVGNAYTDGVGQACFSPNGESYVVIDGVDFSPETPIGCIINAYDFDRCTGLLSRHRQIIEYNGAWVGGAISPNSRYFYGGFQFFARQYDLWADDLEASGVVVMEYDGYESPFPTRSWMHQLMPDGKIYAATSTRSNVLHVIHAPDEPGLDCRYEQHAVHLPTRNAFSTPNFPYFRLGPVDGSSCDTLGFHNLPVAWYRYEKDTLDPLWVQFHDLSYYEPDTWSWDFGDGSPGSVARHPQHVFDSPGVYEVCLTVSNAQSSDTHCKTLYLGVSAAEDPVLQTHISVTPNPFDAHLYVAMSVHLPSAEWRLFDATGRLARTLVPSFGITAVDAGDLPAGCYFWEMTSGGKRIKSGKAVKIK